jgi:hypothetical protein
LLEVIVWTADMCKMSERVEHLIGIIATQWQNYLRSATYLREHLKNRYLKRCWNVM